MKTTKTRREWNNEDMHCQLPNKALDRENARIPVKTFKQRTYLASVFTKKSVVAHIGNF